MPAPVMSASVPAAAAVRVRSEVFTVDWISGGGGDPVREASITMTLTPPGASAANVLASTAPITNGFRATGTGPLYPGDTYVLTTTADSIATSGSPVTATVTFTARSRGVGGAFLAEGYLTGVTAYPLLAEGYIRAMAAYPLLAEGTIRAGGIYDDVPFLAEGAIQPAPGALQNQPFLAEGRIVLFFTQPVAEIGAVVGYRGTEIAEVGGRAIGQGVPAADARVGCVARVLDKSNPVLTVGAVVPLALSEPVLEIGGVAGKRGTGTAEVGSEVKGNSTMGTVEVDSPSTGYVSAGEE